MATIVSESNDYAEMVAKTLSDAGIRVKTDIRNEKIGYKVREHSLAKVPYIFAVGVKEIEDNSVSVRTLGEQRVSNISLDQAIGEFTELVKPPDHQN